MFIRTSSSSGALILLCTPLCCCFSHVQFFATPGTVACQAALSMEFSKREYSSGLPFPSLGGFSGPGTEPRSPALEPLLSPLVPPGNPLHSSSSVQVLTALVSFWTSQLLLLLSESEVTSKWKAIPKCWIHFSRGFSLTPDPESENYHCLHSTFKCLLLYFVHLFSEDWFEISWSAITGCETLVS